PANAGSCSLQRADANDGGGIIEAEIHLAKRRNLFRQTEPSLFTIRLLRWKAVVLVGYGRTVHPNPLSHNR
ncbi:hypothetical protein ACCT09_53805, partial [Rhizobium ruizarguesonis]